MLPLDVSLQVLVLDGGGGKAPVFFGALRALDELGLLGGSEERSHARITHFVGSSTGAIIAALLACEVSATAAEAAVSQMLSSLALEEASPVRSRPAIRTGDAQDISLTFTPVGDVGGLPPVLDAGLRRYANVAGVLRSFLPLERPSSRFRRWMLDRMGVDEALVEAVLADVPAAMSSFYLDGGILDGRDFRQAVDDALCVAVAQRTGRRMSNLTFRQQHTIFERDLSLVATNITNGRSLPFSRLATPDLPVADAIRLCVSLPLIVKPVYLAPEAASAAGATTDYAGLWVDGGVLNSTPSVQVTRNSSGSSDPRLVLSLAPDGTRLFTDGADDVPILRFLPRALLETFWSTTASESQVLEPSHLLALNCDGLSAHRLLPDPEALERAQQRAHDNVKQHLEQRGITTPAAE